MNKNKQLLRKIIREAIEEVGDEANMNNPEEKKEIQIGNGILQLLAAVRVNKNGPESDLIKIENLARELIKMHSKSAVSPEHPSEK